MSASAVSQGICPICKEEIEDSGRDVVEIQQRGAKGINIASGKRGDDIVVTDGDKVHVSCPKRYVNEKYIKSDVAKKSGCSVPAKRSTRQSSGGFDSETDCIFCGCRVELEKGRFSCVRTNMFVKTILEVCESRSDDWGLTVKGRIEYYLHDLHAADGLYHHSCSGNFRSFLGVPLQFQTAPEAKRRKVGRPKNDDKEEAFQKMCSYLELNDEEQLTVSSLRDTMKGFLFSPDSAPYGNYYLKTLLKNRYGDSIHFAEGEGVDDIVTMREQTSHILRSYYRQKCQEGDEQSQKMAIIETAAKLIKSDIKSHISSVTNEYPSTQTFKLNSALSFIPDTLRTLLSTLFVGTDTKRKVVAIGQAIIQAVRPRAVLAPLQVGLAVQTHHLHRSKFLVDVLHEMGFCSSYGEVLRFEKNAAHSVDPDVLGGDIDLLDPSVLFAADNVDHNIITIDGKGTFHGMGIVAAVTPGQRTNRLIPRRNISELQISDYPGSDTHTVL